MSCRAELDSAGFNVELKPTHYFTMFLFWLFLSSSHIMAACEVRNTDIYRKINFDQTVRIHDQYF